MGAPPAVTLYSPDPQHLWNRLYSSLFLRVDAGGNRFGPDSLDVLLWTDTKHLLTEPTHGRAIRVLEEFNETHAEKLIESPLKRAVMQRDLWAAYDWTARIRYLAGKNSVLVAAVSELQSRLAAVMKRIALTREEIAALPNNYAAAVVGGKFPAEPDPSHPEAPFLPSLFQAQSPWSCLGGGDDLPLALQHSNGCSHRAAFLVFIRLPGGKATLPAYLEAIRKCVPYIPDPHPARRRFGGLEPMKPNPAMPQIPAGTMVALIRQMLLIDNEGRPTASPLTESAQLRVYRQIVDDQSDFDGVHAQSFYEFLMDRKELFANVSGGLRAVGEENREFGFGPEVELTGSDPFDSAQAIEAPRPRPLQNCLMCHRAPGVYSVNSIVSLFSRNNPTALQLLHVTSPDDEREKTVKHKSQWFPLTGATPFANSAFGGIFPSASDSLFSGLPPGGHVDRAR